MTISENMSLEEVAFSVCTALDAAGVTAVLTGGGAATVYAPRAIQSLDMDFVFAAVSGSLENGARALARLGYERVSDRYEHPRSRYILEFPEGPLYVGRKPLTSWDSLQKGDQVLHIVSPTDSCCDRLAAYIHWNDRSGLAQAVEVARSRREHVSLNVIRAWLADEGHAAKFEEFCRKLGRESR